eukprot:16431230-Heterocapsa_arctica.AAC.1
MRLDEAMVYTATSHDVDTPIDEITAAIERRKKLITDAPPAAVIRESPSPPRVKYVLGPPAVSGQPYQAASAASTPADTPAGTPRGTGEAPQDKKPGQARSYPQIAPTYRGTFGKHTYTFTKQESAGDVAKILSGGSGPLAVWRRGLRQ